MATHSSIPAWRMPMDRGAWWATVHRVTKSQRLLKQLSMHACTYHKLTVFLCGVTLTALRFSFLIYKIEIITSPISMVCFKDYMRQYI